MTQTIKTVTNKDIGAKVQIDKVLLDINPKDGWVYQKKVTGTIEDIIEHDGEGYYFSSNGDDSSFRVHRYKDFYTKYLIKLDDGLIDLAGNNIVPRREFDIKFLEKKKVLKTKKRIDLKKLVNSLDEYEREELKHLLNI